MKRVLPMKTPMKSIFHMNSNEKCPPYAVCTCRKAEPVSLALIEAQLREDAEFEGETPPPGSRATPVREAPGHTQAQRRRSSALISLTVDVTRVGQDATGQTVDGGMGTTGRMGTMGPTGEMGTAGSTGEMGTAGPTGGIGQGTGEGRLQIAETKVMPASPEVTPISIEKLTNPPPEAEFETNILSPKSMSSIPLPLFTYKKAILYYDILTC